MKKTRASSVPGSDAAPKSTKREVTIKGNSIVFDGALAREMRSLSRRKEMTVDEILRRAIDEFTPTQTDDHAFDAVTKKVLLPADLVEWAERESGHLDCTFDDLVRDTLILERHRQTREHCSSRKGGAQ